MLGNIARNKFDLSAIELIDPIEQDIPVVERVIGDCRELRPPAQRLGNADHTFVAALVEPNAHAPVEINL